MCAGPVVSVRLRFAVAAVPRPALSLVERVLGNAHLPSVFRVVVGRPQDLATVLVVVVFPEVPAVVAIIVIYEDAEVAPGGR